tara:strand:- start:301 stop:609 length:309 start_codon:yes stop_codon:yes gene_type:complete
MKNEELYRVRSNLNKPFKIMSLTVDELVIVVSSILTFFFCNELITKGLIVAGGMGLLWLVRMAKKDRGPKVLLVYLYWLLPSSVTQFFMCRVPASHKRIWTS